MHCYVPILDYCIRCSIRLQERKHIWLSVWRNYEHSDSQAFFLFLSEVNFCVSLGPHLIPSDSNVHLGSTACCLELTMVWRGRAAHTDRELTTVFTGQRLHFQMTADNCFTWPWLLWPADRDLTCQVRFTGMFLVNDGEFQWSLFGVLESDSTSINQCDMWLSFL